MPRRSGPDRALLKRSRIDPPVIGRGIVVVDGSGGGRMSGIGGWLMSPSGAVEHWSVRMCKAASGEVEVDALIYGAHRAIRHDPTIKWVLYSDRISVAEELAETSSRLAETVIDWVLSGRIVITWVSRDLEILQAADALARAGRLLPVQPTNLTRLIRSMARETSC